MACVAGLALLLSGLLASGQPRVALAEADPATSLTQLHSRNGVLAVTLRAEETTLRLDDLALPARVYNGLYAGPVLRVRQGDLLVVRLENRLRETTNLHFHGIRASPRGNGDNVHLAFAPGENFTYELRIPPTQPPGLYWYHSHIHGLSERQVMGGLSGALVVEAAQPDEAAPPGRAERLFVLKDMIFEDDTGNARIDADLHGIVQSINGQLALRAALRPGEVQLWRFSNQSANRAFHLALPGHRFRIVAEDGEAVLAPREVDVLDIMPAGRVEVLVEGGAPGRYDLLSKGTMTGTGAARKPDRVLGEVAIAGPPMPAGIAAPEGRPALEDLRAAPIQASRVVTFSQTKTLNAEAQRFFVDGRLFDPDRIDLRVPLGNVEEWTVRNESDDLHVFHIHQLGFQVVAVNGVAAPFTGRVDTVRVPERGEVTLRLAFTDPLILGRFMFHCHVLRHEDKGMMAQIEIYDPAPPARWDWLHRVVLHLWWWSHGVPWSLCGLEL